MSKRNPTPSRDDATERKEVKMRPESLQSPNAIPPRRSSSIQARTSSLAQERLATKTVLEPLAEGSWMSPGPKFQHTMNLSQHSGDSYPPGNFVERADTAIHANDSTWSQDKEKIVLGPYEYMEGNPGKDIRKQMISAFNAWLQVPKESLEIITKVIGMLHTSSLLIDDVEDSSLLRRGVPVAHLIFGTAQTINSANYIYFAALQELLKLGNTRAIEIYTHELCNLHRGQGMDLFWRDSLTCPTENDYLEMVGNKTGGLFRLAVQLMQAESTSEKNYIPLVNTIGLLFQIRDDYMNLASPEYTSNKGLCEDLTEGKFSFPIIHSIAFNPSNRQLLSILKQKTEDSEVKRYAVKYMESTGSFAYCREVLKQLKAKAIGMIDDLDLGADTGAGVRVILDKMDVSTSMP